MKTVIGVRFRADGKMYYFDPGEHEIKEGDSVIVDTAQGMEFADVVMGPKQIPDEQLVSPLKNVLRLATNIDIELRNTNRAKEKDAYATCVEKIEKHNLDMKLVDVEYAFNGSKIVFFFTADGRIDFRELVKDLAAAFKTRIELRQIGVRDEAKMLGGLGSCGRPICCKAFLDEFQPVSIRMAKEQNLSLSPTKISGLCGRLMCCLKYEQDTYEHVHKLMPKVNRIVMTPQGRGQVLENNIISERTRVRVTLEDGTPDIKEFPYQELKVINDGIPQTTEKDESLDSLDELAIDPELLDSDILPDEDMKPKKEFNHKQNGRQGYKGKPYRNRDDGKSNNNPGENNQQ